MTKLKKGQLLKVNETTPLFGQPAPSVALGSLKRGQLVVVLQEQFDMWSVVKVYSQDLGTQGWVLKESLVYD